jgi:hypothetical protein
LPTTPYFFYTFALFRRWFSKPESFTHLFQIQPKRISSEERKEAVEVLPLTSLATSVCDQDGFLTSPATPLIALYRARILAWFSRGLTQYYF